MVSDRPRQKDYVKTAKLWGWESLIQCTTTIQLYRSELAMQPSVVGTGAVF